MLELTLILAIGLLVGIIIGLLPGLPAYLGPIFLLPFVQDLSVIQILTFWLACQIGSQYFGSVAAILLKIPGEASSMVYVKDLNHLSSQERYSLVRQTAWGSTVGTLLSLVILILIYWAGLQTELIKLTSTSVKLIVLTILVSTLIWFSDKKIISTGLFVLGVFLSEKTNQNLPAWVFDIQTYTSDLTVFSIILSLLIIPEFINELLNKYSSEHTPPIQILKDPIKWRNILNGTYIGSLVGLVPGPSTILASMLAYRNKPHSDLSGRIISSESANNSATITSLLPFLYIGLPITLSEMLLVDILRLKMFNLPTGLFNKYGLFNLLEICFFVIAICGVIYHFLAQKFLKFYRRVIELAYGKLVWLYVAILAYIIYIDIQFIPVDLFRYLTYIVLLSILGYYWLTKKINVLPFIFGYLLGDMILWTVYHFYMLYFY